MSDQAGDHVTRTLATALTIRTISSRLGMEVREIGRPLQVRAAVNTGRPFLGNIGVAHSRDYTIIGDVVNVAFRLEGLASSLGCELVLESRVFAILREPRATLLRMLSKVRGKSDAVTLYGCDFSVLERYLAALHE